MAGIVYYSGILALQSNGEEDVLFLKGDEYPLADRLQDDISSKTVSIRYWISDEEKSIEELFENQVLVYSGALEADYNMRYSELTGYLWTDEEIKVGGHNLLSIFKSNEGRFLFMEVTIHS